MIIIGYGYDTAVRTPLREGTDSTEGVTPFAERHHYDKLLRYNQLIYNVLPPPRKSALARRNVMAEGVSGCVR